MAAHLCDEHVAILAEVWKPASDGASALNDVYAAKATAPDVASVVQQLDAGGLQTWLEEGDG
jgi:hypothetical protein